MGLINQLHTKEDNYVFQPKTLLKSQARCSSFIGLGEYGTCFEMKMNF